MRGNLTKSTGPAMRKLALLVPLAIGSATPAWAWVDTPYDLSANAPFLPSAFVVAANAAAPTQAPGVAPAAPPQPEKAQRDEEEQIDLRRPQGQPLKYHLPPIDPAQVPPPLAIHKRESISVPDRWRIMEALGQKQNWWDPYNINVYKGDKPFEPFAKWGPDWFLAVSVISDSVYEARRLPTPVGAQSSDRSGAVDLFGQGKSFTLNQNIILSLAAIKGNTTFKPPDYEFRLVPVFNVNYTETEEVRGIRLDPRAGLSRNDNHVGIQEAFVDIHLRNVSPRYDFDSVRIGIQPFQSDFRGFLFQDVPFGVRLFGNRDDNRWQYNLAWLRKVDKDTNSGLNDLNRPFRRDDTFVANVFRQDWPVLGHTTQATILHNINRDGRTIYFNNNGLLERPAVLGDNRPHNYRVTYFGLNGDGHFGRWNLTSSLYAAFGKDERHPLAQQEQDIRAFFAAAELSRDFSWMRVRGTAIVASADKDPFDDKATGYDAIFENPQIAGADTSFWIRQSIPLVGGGGVGLSGRNGVLASLRSSIGQGQSNFVNPGVSLFGVGADVDVTPQTRAVLNLNKLSFLNTTSLSVLRNQEIVKKDIGWDISAAVQYRPFMSQNVILNASAAMLIPGKAMKQLYDEDKRGNQYSVLVNLLLTY
jgi:hypothetical protein